MLTVQPIHRVAPKLPATQKCHFEVNGDLNVIGHDPVPHRAIPFKRIIRLKLLSFLGAERQGSLSRKYSPCVIRVSNVPYQGSATPLRKHTAPSAVGSHVICAALPAVWTRNT